MDGPLGTNNQTVFEFCALKHCIKIWKELIKEKEPWNLTFYIWPLWVLFLYDHKIFVFILCYWSISCAIIYIESLRGRRNAVKPVYKGHLKEPENVPFISRCPFKYRVRLYALFSKWKKWNCPLFAIYRFPLRQVRLCLYIVK